MTLGHGQASVIGAEVQLGSYRAHFGNRIVFHTPGMRCYRTSEYKEQNPLEFVPISLTGTQCALRCAHCQTTLLRGMVNLPQSKQSLYELCVSLEERGARGVLVSGGSDAAGRVPLKRHIPDLIRVRRELGLAIRVHPGLPDEETCVSLKEVQVDGVMLDIIGDAETIRNVYHLDATPEDYEAALARLERHGIPTIPHIILGLHYGKMLGEWNALEMIARHSPQFLVLVLLTPVAKTEMAKVTLPSVEDAATFFQYARHKMPVTPVFLGCARPLGPMKASIDQAAIDAGLNGIAYPAEGTVAYAKSRGLEPVFVDSCCGVNYID